LFLTVVEACHLVVGHGFEELLGADTVILAGRRIKVEELGLVDDGASDDFGICDMIRRDRRAEGIEGIMPGLAEKGLFALAKLDNETGSTLSKLGII
jgi:hypothetical protein